MDNKYTQFITDYNYQLKYVGRLYASKCKNTPNEETANRNLRRIIFIVNETPLFMLNETGPYLLKYADYIKNNNWDIFMNMEYKDIDDSQAGKAQIELLKNTYKLCTDPEKNIITRAVVEMLSIYCKYIIKVKNSDC